MNNSNWTVLAVCAVTLIALMLSPLEYVINIIVFGLPIILLIFVGILFATKLYSKKETEGEEERSVVFQVPNNTRWILRNVWDSDPKTGRGYQSKPQGYRIKIPYIWHKDEGMVPMIPVQKDPESISVNCKDGNPVDVDARITYFVRDEKSDDNVHASILHVINTKGVDINLLVTQRFKVALNRAMDVASDEAIIWTSDEKKAYGEEATKIINDLLKNDRIAQQGSEDDSTEATQNNQNIDKKDYGLAAIVNVQNVSPPATVQAAKERLASAKIEEKAAESEAAAMKIMITETGANATCVMIAQMVADALRPLTKLKKGGKKNAESSN